MWDSSHKSLIPDPGNTGPSGLIARGAHGCIAMYDITDKDSLYSAAKQIEEFRNSARPEAQAMLIGNKFDMASTKRQIHISEASALVKHYDMTGIMETSVKNNQGIEEAIELLIDAIYSNVLLQDSVDLGSKTPGIRKYDGCCS
ncbi:ras-related protein Rab-43-like [Oscarella lobularis]|uniref:ras-related protein Rab-43-like n=1 Tax=Oscarella lobularis TaxID=121494 RepID=UPI0033139ECB